MIYFKFNLNIFISTTKVLYSTPLCSCPKPGIRRCLGAFPMRQRYLSQLLIPISTKPPSTHPETARAWRKTAEELVNIGRVTRKMRRLSSSLQGPMGYHTSQGETRMSGSFHTGSLHNFGPKTNADPQRGSHGGTGAELRSSGCWDMGLENNKHPIRWVNQALSTPFPHNSGYAVPSRSHILCSPAPASYTSSRDSRRPSTHLSSQPCPLALRSLLRSGPNYVAPPATPIRRLESVAHPSRQPREQVAGDREEHRVRKGELDLDALAGKIRWLGKSRGDGDAAPT